MQKRKSYFPYAFPGSSLEFSQDHQAHGNKASLSLGEKHPCKVKHTRLQSVSTHRASDTHHAPWLGSKGAKLNKQLQVVIIYVSKSKHPEHHSSEHFFKKSFTLQGKDGGAAPGTSWERNSCRTSARSSLATPEAQQSILKPNTYRCQIAK